MEDCRAEQNQCETARVREQKLAAPFDGGKVPSFWQIWLRRKMASHSHNEQKARLTAVR